MKLIQEEIHGEENQTNGYSELTDDHHFSSGGFLSKNSNNENLYSKFLGGIVWIPCWLLLTVRKFIAPTITEARPADTQDLANLKKLTIKCWWEVRSSKLSSVSFGLILISYLELKNIKGPIPQRCRVRKRFIQINRGLMLLPFLRSFRVCSQLVLNWSDLRKRVMWRLESNGMVLASM